MAEPLYLRSLSILERTLGTDHLIIAVTLDQLSEFTGSKAITQAEAFCDDLFDSGKIIGTSGSDGWDHFGQLGDALLLATQVRGSRAAVPEIIGRLGEGPWTRPSHGGHKSVQFSRTLHSSKEIRRSRATLPAGSNHSRQGVDPGV